MRETEEHISSKFSVPDHSPRSLRLCGSKRVGLSAAAELFSVKIPFIQYFKKYQSSSIQNPLVFCPAFCDRSVC